jgi:hypothetical protein
LTVVEDKRGTVFVRRGHSHNVVNLGAHPQPRQTLEMAETSLPLTVYYLYTGTLPYVYWTNKFANSNLHRNRDVHNWPAILRPNHVTGNQPGPQSENTFLVNRR